MSVFSERLKLIMQMRSVTQAQLSALTGIPKSAISQYLSRKFKPKQARVCDICRALDISPAWIMGYDDIPNNYDSTEEPRLSEIEYNIIQTYRSSLEFRQGVDELLIAINKNVLSKHGIFRAANSSDGKTAPGKESISSKRLHKLVAAPETDEDL